MNQLEIKNDSIKSIVISTRGRNLKISETAKRSLDVSHSLDMTEKGEVSDD